MPKLGILRSEAYLWHDVAVSVSGADGEPLLAQARSCLRSLLGEEWGVGTEATGVSETNTPRRDSGVDEVWTIEARRSRARPSRIAVAARATFAPTSLQTVKPALLGQHQDVDGALVVASWLSPRGRELLEQQGVNYLDLTGNASINLPRSAVIIRTEGAQQNPTPEPRGQRGLSGPRAARLVRELVDIAPSEPWQASDLVERTGLSQGYVSRLLNVMVEQALVRREGRLIVDVDWAGLLRARASAYQLMRVGHHVPVVARRGRNRLLGDLAAGAGRHPAVMTGSDVAEQVAPLAIGGPLMLYIPQGPHVVDETAKDLGLLRTGQPLQQSLRGADVVLMQPPTDLPMLRTQTVEGVTCVAHSQLVLDCLSGPGRMPAEGEAVLAWMQDNVSTWRVELKRPSGAAGRRRVEDA